MPVIPNQLSLNRRLPTGKSAIATYNPAPSGFHDAADVFNSVTVALDKRTDGEVSKAKADFLVMKAEQDAAYDNDEDYKTIQERYTEKMTTGMGNLAGNISDPEARTAFTDWARPSVATGIQGAKKKAFNAESDYEVGGLNERLEKLREASMTGEVTVDPVTGERSDPMIMGRNAANDMIDYMVAQNFMKATDGVAMKKSFKTSVAIGKLEMMEPENRVYALKQDWAKNLPSDTHAKLLRAAEDELIDDKAQRIVDGFNDKNFDLGQADEASRKIKDADLRAEVETRYNVLYTRRKMDTLDSQKSFVDDQWDSIKSGDITVRQLKAKHRDEWDNLTASQQNTMYAAEASRAKASPNRYNSDAELLLNKLKHQKDFPSLLNKFLEVRSTLSPEQDKRWSSVSIDGAVPEEYNGMMTASQLVTARFQKDKTTSKSLKADTLLAVDDFVRRETELNKGVAPTNDKINSFIDDRLMDYDPPGWGNSGMLSTMSDKNKNLLLDEFRTTDPVAWGRVSDLLPLIDPNASKDEWINSLRKTSEGDIRWAITRIKRTDRKLFNKAIKELRMVGKPFSNGDVIDQYVYEREKADANR